MTTSRPLTTEELLGVLARGDAQLIEGLTTMTAGAFERSGLDEETYLLIRIAALIAMDASPASYLVNLGAAVHAGVPAERLEGVLVALAPLVGSARTVTAAGNIVQAFDLH
ncbi:carboxymuconolactone decarboxylase family protein [Streptacidiphilus sp. ASG 303]|uniref:carboxymuconolactone decarboxylase family protein n=1 Tax=Streptomycetaceae TaxID=2062 RepID=UPI001E4B9E80|nr:carboxymuconolactone decarboxylase family protein [Streptacidiphilus sp. ASG 303]MCD0484477.1 carboxymuconolactone decarboxylase family protein [Streptacidiphilus sp. ASG 303]